MQAVLDRSSQQQPLTPLVSADTAGSDDLAGGQGQSEADQVVVGDQLTGCGALLPQQVVDARGGQACRTPADDDDVEVCRHAAILGRP